MATAFNAIVHSVFSILVLFLLRCGRGLGAGGGGGAFCAGGSSGGSAFGASSTGGGSGALARGRGAGGGSCAGHGGAFHRLRLLRLHFRLLAVRDLRQAEDALGLSPLLFLGELLQALSAGKDISVPHEGVGAFERSI